MPHNTWSVFGFEKYWGLDSLCSYLFPYIYSPWACSRADRAKLTPATQVVFAASCEVRAHYTDPCTSEGCCQSKFLPVQHSENEQFWKFCFPRQSVCGQSKPEKLHTSSKHRRTLDQSLSMIQWRNCYWTWIATHLCFLERSSNCESWLQTSNLSKKENIYIHPKSVSDYSQFFNHFYHGRN